MNATGNGQQATGNEELRKGHNIAERLLDFGALAIGVARRLPKDPAGKHVALQLERSATAGGANHEEARAAESPADFVHKVRIAAKEMREAGYWVQLIQRCAKRPTDLTRVAREASELAAILGASARTARRRIRSEK